MPDEDPILWMPLSLNAAKTGLKNLHFSPLCGYEVWNAIPPAATLRLFIAASSCSENNECAMKILEEVDIRLSCVRTP